MKKKFNAFGIIGLGIISYLICIIFGLISKHVFAFGDVDVLSSSATLFAGMVALVLFRDWREQQNFITLEKKHEALLNKVTQVKNRQHELILGIRNNIFMSDDNGTKSFLYSHMISIYKDVNDIRIESKSYKIILDRYSFKSNHVEKHNKLCDAITGMDTVFDTYRKLLYANQLSPRLNFFKQKNSLTPVIDNVNTLQKFLANDMENFISEVAKSK